MNKIKEACTIIQEMSIVLAVMFIVCVCMGHLSLYFFPHMKEIFGGTVTEYHRIILGTFWTFIAGIIYIACKIFIEDVYAVYYAIRELINSYKGE